MTKKINMSLIKRRRPHLKQIVCTRCKFISLRERLHPKFICNYCIAKMKKKKYCEKYDTYFNRVTGEYVEQKCGYDSCKFCMDRPDEILEACKKCKFKLPSGGLCKESR